MLNIFKQKINKKDLLVNKSKVIPVDNNSNWLKIVKHFPATTKE